MAGDACPNVGWWYIAFIVILVLAKINASIIIKYNSSTLMWISSSVAVPLSTIGFNLKFIMGDNTSHMTVFLWIGLVVVFLGLLLYRSTKEIEKKH